jgi:hypothetical protein
MSEYILHAVNKLTAAKKNGIAVQKGESLIEAAKICAIIGSPIACPRLSRTTIAANSVAFASSDIQYETRESAETLLPNPAANINTPILVRPLVEMFNTHSYQLEAPSYFEQSQ